MIGNIINFNNILSKITAAQAANDQATVAQQYGRAAYLLINFNPIEDSSLDSDSGNAMRNARDTSFFEDRFDEIWEATGLSDGGVANKVEAFVSSFFRASVSSQASDSAVCEGNSSILFDDFAVIQQELSNGSYNATAATFH
jgi:hypothetical protein